MIEVSLKLISNSKKTVFIHSANVEEIHLFILNNYKWSRDNYYLRSNGHQVLDSKDIIGSSVEVIPRLCGGKGGFGSMLRAIGAQIEKTTNREACRDLSGRRLRDINEEQRLKKWISQQAEREREIEEKRKRKLEKLTKEPNHDFKDEKYFEERSEMTEKLNDAFEQGLMASTSSSKRRNEKEKKPLKKKKKLIVDFDEFSSSDDSGENNDSDVSDNVQNPQKLSNDRITSECKDVDKLSPRSSEDEKENEGSASKETKCSSEVHKENADNNGETSNQNVSPQNSSTNTVNKTEESKLFEQIEAQSS